MLKLFKIVAFLEGISYISLFSNMLFLKPNYFEIYKTLLFPIGMAHGILFIAYLYLAFMLKNKMKWTIYSFLIICLCSLIPFGTFYMEKKYLKNV